MRPLFGAILLGTLAVLPACKQEKPEGQSAEVVTAPPVAAEQYAHLSGTTFVTNDLDTSVAFYSDFLGFVERRRVVMDSPASLGVFGVAEGETITYAALVPAKWSEENSNFPGLNFAKIETSEANPYAPDKFRNSIYGEIVLAFSAVNLQKIERDMRSADVEIVTPLAASATGKSITLTVLDPNGIRVQIYEYVKAE